MNLFLKPQIRTLLAVCILSIAGRAAAENLIVYPNNEKPLFSIEVPENWKLYRAESDDQFFQVSGPAGVVMWFRAKVMTSEKEIEKAAEAARESGKEWLAESYADVVLEKAAIGERNGLPFAGVKGTGVYKRTSEAVNFTVAFIALPNGSLAQFWGIVPKKDATGERYFQKVLDSFKAK